jgi:predicted kinase
MLTRPKPAIVALCGMPGAGKSTAASSAIGGRVIHVSVDECRAVLGAGPRDQTVTRDAFNLAYDQARDAIDFSNAVVLFDSTAITVRARASLKRFASRCRAPISLVVFPLTWEQVLERNAGRPECDRVPVPRLRDMYRDYEQLDPLREGFKQFTHATGPTELLATLTTWRLT